MRLWVLESRGGSEQTAVQLQCFDRRRFQHWNAARRPPGLDQLFVKWVILLTAEEFDINLKNWKAKEMV
jgi:hypothetical protein